MAVLGNFVKYRKRVNDDRIRAEKIIGLWLCGANCADKFLREKKKWTHAGWA